MLGQMFRWEAVQRQMRSQNTRLVDLMLVNKASTIVTIFSFILLCAQEGFIAQKPFALCFFPDSRR